MDFGRFLDERRGAWKQLEQLLERVETDGLKAMPADEVRDLARLYRKASADLLLARDVSARADAVDYLEALVARSYTAVYGGRRIRWASAWTYFTHTWPRRLRAERAYVYTAASVFGLGFLSAFVLTLAQPAAFDHLVPPEFASFYIDRPDDYRDARFGEMSDSDAAAFSSTLMVNNVRVTLNAFALGLTAGIGTVAMIFYNGVLLGAIAANFLRWDQSLEFWALILPHGVVEMFAMVLGGASGLILADAILRPGRRRRREALRERGADALLLVGVIVPMLVFAGIVEGYVTPMSILPPAGKLVFAGLTALGLAAWIRAPWLRDAAPPA